MENVESCLWVRKGSVQSKADSVSAIIKAKGDTFEGCVDIEPVAGENEVSVAAFNDSNTIQSLIKTVHFNAGVKPTDPRLYILSIGIDHYKDGSIDLRYAAKDAKDLEEKIREKSATLYEQRNIHYARLTDTQATKNPNDIRFFAIAQNDKRVFP